MRWKQKWSKQNNEENIMFELRFNDFAGMNYFLLNLAIRKISTHQRKTRLFALIRLQLNICWSKKETENSSKSNQFIHECLQHLVDNKISKISPEILFFCSSKFCDKINTKKQIK